MYTRQTWYYITIHIIIIYSCRDTGISCGYRLGLFLLKAKVTLKTNKMYKDKSVGTSYLKLHSPELLIKKRQDSI